MERSQQAWNRVSVCYAALGTLAILAALSWCLWPTKLELSDDTYDVAIALYRVCNQQDDEGLRLIQRKLDELKNLVASDDPAITHLQHIVDEARSGSWTAAMRHTRKALEDQVPGA